MSGVSISLEDFKKRFWKRVDKSGGPDACWLWKASFTHGGYGQMGGTWSLILGRRSNRITWILTHGVIPDGMDVLHNCPTGDNPACCNPKHLWLGTKRDNNKDRDGKGRQAKGEKHGNRKLTAKRVIKIRNMYRAGCWSMTELADWFKMSVATIHNIVRRKGWRHIP